MTWKVSKDRKTPNTTTLFRIAWWSSAVKELSSWLSACAVIYEPAHDKTNKMIYGPSEDSDQPGHPPGLIRVFAVHIKKPWILSYILGAQRRLWLDWADAQAVLSLSVGIVMRLLMYVFVFLFRFLFWVGCGIRLYRFLIIAFPSMLLTWY